MKASKCKRNRAPPVIYFLEGKNIGRAGPDRGTRSGLGEDQKCGGMPVFETVINSQGFISQERPGGNLRYT